MIVPFERYSQFTDENGKLTLRAASFLEELATEINLNTPVQGSGSPEGVITAEIGQRYMDTAGTAGSVLYIKQSGSGDTGWILV